MSASVERFADEAVTFGGSEQNCDSTIDRLRKKAPKVEFSDRDMLELETIAHNDGWRMKYID